MTRRNQLHVLIWKTTYLVVIENMIARSQLGVCETYDVMKIQERAESCQKYVLEAQNSELQLIAMMKETLQQCDVVTANWKKDK